MTYGYYVNNGGNLEYESRVLNENGTTLLAVTGASGIYVSEFQGLSNKLIALIYGTMIAGKVYGLPTIGTIGISEFTHKDKIKIFPNPTSEFIQITSDFEIKFDDIKIYNTEGKCVLELLQYRYQTIDVSYLNKGIYFISGYQDNDILFHSKFIVD